MERADKLLPPRESGSLFATMRELFQVDISPRLASYWAYVESTIGKPVCVGYAEKCLEKRAGPCFGAGSILPGKPIAGIVLTKHLVGLPVELIEAVAAHEVTHVLCEASGFWHGKIRDGCRIQFDFSPYTSFSSTLNDLVVDVTIADLGFDVSRPLQLLLDNYLSIIQSSRFPARDPWTTDYQMLNSISILLELTFMRRTHAQFEGSLEQIRGIIVSKAPDIWQWYSSILEYVGGYDLFDPEQHNACLVWLSERLKSKPKVRFFLRDSFSETPVSRKVILKTLQKVQRNSGRARMS